MNIDQNEAKARLTLLRLAQKLYRRRSSDFLCLCVEEAAWELATDKEGCYDTPTVLGVTEEIVAHIDGCECVEDFIAKNRSKAGKLVLAISTMKKEASALRNSILDQMIAKYEEMACEFSTT